MLHRFEPMQNLILMAKNHVSESAKLWRMSKRRISSGHACIAQVREMENVPMEEIEIARAVSGTVTSALSKIANEKETSSSHGGSNYPDYGDDFPTVSTSEKKKTGQNFYVFMKVSALYVCN